MDIKKLPVNVEKHFCDECSLALRRFIGHMEGVDSIDVERGKSLSALTIQELMRRSLRRSQGRA